jgi:hypothetical protein
MLLVVGHSVAMASGLDECAGHAEELVQAVEHGEVADHPTHHQHAGSIVPCCLSACVVAVLGDPSLPSRASASVDPSETAAPSGLFPGGLDRPPRGAV